ncbi:MAG: SdpI family protein [Oscillospiraceae bacterium]
MKVFYIVFTLFVPILMTVCGIAMKKCHSDESDNIIGYRTKGSVKNKDTWKFAIELAGTLWIMMSAIII